MFLDGWPIIDSYFRDRNLAKMEIDSFNQFVEKKLEEINGAVRKRASDKSKDISERLKIAKKEISFSKKYDYVIVNNKLDEAVRRLKSIIITKRCET